MAVFAYRAIDTSSAVVRGVLAADTPRQARESLRAKGLTVHKIAPAAQNQRPRFAGRDSATVVSFVRELSTLLGAGITLLDAIDAIAQQHRGRFRASLALLHDRVRAGAGLADAMREQPAVFDELTVNVVEVGEQAGSLESVLDRIAGFKEKSLRFRNRVASALAYPCFVLVMATTVAVGLMTFVIPKLLETLVDSGRELPFSTRVVKAASDFLIHRWWLLLAVLATGALVAAAALRSRAGRMRWHRLQLRLPVIGPMARKQAIARAAVVIATMMKSGIVFVRAVRIAARGTHNLAVREALERCEAAVAAGRDISQALESTGAFPATVVRIFSVGQRSGRLEEMLERLAADYEAQVAAASERFTAVLEPALVLFLVGVVGLIAFATIQPLLEAADVF